jgi:hypothetical protein
MRDYGRTHYRNGTSFAERLQRFKRAFEINGVKITRKFLYIETF